MTSVMTRRMMPKIATRAIFVTEEAKGRHWTNKKPVKKPEHLKKFSTDGAIGAYIVYLQILVLFVL